jgi:CRISPR/Cas system CMR subunit Cmr4 (Cas7 group RAMP superfamily)
VIRDSNGLPYIPSTSITGVLRHSLTGIIEESDLNEIFGAGGDKGKGSLFQCTSAYLVDFSGKVAEGSRGDINPQDEFYRPFFSLPIRQHVCITDKGVAKEGGKFDQEVVYKGTRFCFEMELLCDKEACDKEACDKEAPLQLFKEKILPRLTHVSFRLGGGTRKGLGAIKVVSFKGRQLDLSNSEDMNAYLTKSSSLNAKFVWDENESKDEESMPKTSKDGWTTYTLSLLPDDFYFFGSGLSNLVTDMNPVEEPVIDYGQRKFTKKQILIPASSIKGALAHRMAFYYNMIMDEKRETKTGKWAVDTLFGCEKDGENETSRGHVIFSDIYREAGERTILNHVCIDRFTGGAMDGFLFNEEVVYDKDTTFSLEINVEDNVLTGDLRTAFEAALHDLCNGLLPLGGSTNRGHGCFTGTIEQ